MITMSTELRQAKIDEICSSSSIFQYIKLPHFLSLRDLNFSMALSLSNASEQAECISLNIRMCITGSEFKRLPNLLEQIAQSKYLYSYHQMQVCLLGFFIRRISAICFDDC